MSEFEKVKPYSTPVLAERLVRGSAYYILSYFDDDLTIPEIRTIVYIGKNVDDVEDGMFYFQNFESYFRLGSYPNHRHGDGEVFRFPETGLATVFELPEVVNSLKSCIRRSRLPDE